MNEIINMEENFEVSSSDLLPFTERAIGAIPELKGRFATISFVSDREIRKLNNSYRKIDSTTDVLSFPFSAEEFEKNLNFLGDIVISTDQARRQAKENRLDLEVEIKQLILHGILHLAGYDHEADNGEMNGLELKLRDKLGIC